MKTNPKSLLLFMLIFIINGCFLSRDPHGRRTDRGKRYPQDKPREQRQ